MPVAFPKMTRGGMIELTTLASASYTPFPSRSCDQLTLVNDTGVTLQVRVVGSTATCRVPNGMAMPFYGLGNAAELEVHAVDNTAKLVTARWEEI